MASHLYRMIYLDGTYVVYRHCFDTSKCTLVEGAREHKQAAFITELAAIDYCRYRNDMIDQNGSDALNS